ncbi:class I SAM-dependent methyltransferase [Micromonospora gifhornensis]|uniref:class I SAM-dependent methyltransferase n=1 Tax=Micromonospora gifhornensis TaxID=84594 RepID=UPI003D75BC3A
MNQRTWGDRRHPAILLFAADLPVGLSGDDVCRRLAAATRFVIRLDDETDGTADDDHRWTTAALAALDRWEVRRAHLVGGASAARMARHHADRVESVSVPAGTHPGQLPVPTIPLDGPDPVLALIRLTSGGWDPQGDRLAARAIAAGDTTGWFEELYAGGLRGEVDMPWDRTFPHPLLAEWAEREGVRGAGRRAVVTGCGLGADAEFLTGLGFRALGFDVAESAIKVARDRHRGSGTEYAVGDLLDPPADWIHAFDLVVDVITVQALPEPPRHTAIVNVGRLVAPGGTLLVIAYRSDGSTYVMPPWPLTRAEIDAYGTDGLVPVRIEELTIDGGDLTARWRAEFHRPH